MTACLFCSSSFWQSGTHPCQRRIAGQFILYAMPSKRLSFFTSSRLSPPRYSKSPRSRHRLCGLARAPRRAHLPPAAMTVQQAGDRQAVAKPECASPLRRQLRRVLTSAEMPLVAFLCLMHFRTSLFLLVLSCAQDTSIIVESMIVKPK